MRSADKVGDSTTSSMVVARKRAMSSAGSEPWQRSMRRPRRRCISAAISSDASPTSSTRDAPRCRITQRRCTTLAASNITVDSTTKMPISDRLSGVCAATRITAIAATPHICVRRTSFTTCVRGPVRVACRWMPRRAAAKTHVGRNSSSR